MVRQCGLAGGQWEENSYYKNILKSLNFMYVKTWRNCHHNKRVNLQDLSVFIWAELYNLLIGMSSLCTGLISHFNQYNFKNHMTGVCLVPVCHIILLQMFLSKMTYWNIPALVQEREFFFVFCITLHLLQLQPTFLLIC